MVSSYKNISKTIFEEMGRRKFRLSVHRKNEERRKAAPALRRVSVPSDLITAVPVGSMTIQIVKLWVTLCGFSLCGAWMEAYKVANKKATQKAKAMI